jgi:hypothetical protein
MCYFFAIVGHYAKNLHWCLEITIVCYKSSLWWYPIHNWWLYFQMCYIKISIGSTLKPSLCKDIDFLPSHEKLALQWNNVLYFTIIMSMPFIQTPNILLTKLIQVVLCLSDFKKILYSRSQSKSWNFNQGLHTLVVSLILFHWEWTSCSLQSWSVAGAIAGTMNKEKLTKVVLDHPNRERGEELALHCRIDP